MRWFDHIGILAVGGWLVLTGTFVYRHEMHAAAESQLRERKVPLRDGEDWLVLKREGDDVGFVHRRRTRLESGWLVEYDLLVILDLLETRLPIESSIRARLDSSARLENFDADLQGAGEEYSARGTVRGSNLELVVRAGRGPRRRDVTLEEPPRLASNAIHQVVGRDDLEAGETFESEFFDPTAMTLRTIQLEYLGQEPIAMNGEPRAAYHIRQTVRGSAYDVYVDDRGRILRQDFPMGVQGVRVPKESGKRRAEALREEAEEARREFTAGETVDESVRSALDLLGFGMPPATSPQTIEGDTGPDDPDADSTPRPETQP